LKAIPQNNNQTASNNQILFPFWLHCKVIQKNMLKSIIWLGLPNNLKSN